MKKLITPLLLIIALHSQAQVVISQVYGGGGNNGATLTNDFIELFNKGTAPVTLTGWSVQYNSATSTTTTWQITNIPTVTIQAGQYFLIQEAAGSTGTVALPTPDVTGVIALSGTTGKVALVNNQTAYAISCPNGDGSVMDFVGYGPTANCSEGSSPAPVLTNITAALRNSNGCMDTNVNSADFKAGTPNPRNTASPLNVCGSGPTPTLSAGALTAYGAVCVNTTAGPNTFTITGTNLTSANVTVGALAGYTYSTTSTGTYTASLNLTQAGGSYSQAIFVKFSPTAAQAYDGNIAVGGAGATAINVAASGSGTTSAAAVSTGGATAVTQSSATLAATITSTGCSAITSYGIEYSPTMGFVNGAGTPVTSTNLTSGVFSSDVSGLSASTTYYYHAFATNSSGTVYGSEMSFTTGGGTTPTGGLVISQVYGAGGNGGATYNADYVELKNTSTAPISLSGYSIQYASATTTSTWTGVYALPSVSIAAGGYYLIQMSGAGAIGTALPTPDAVANPAINMSATAGRVALVNGTTPLSACPASSSYVDLAGFGTSICFEGAAAAPAPSPVIADFRKNNGCTDTDNNGADFETLLPAPRNSATAPVPCNGPLPTLSASALTAFGNVCVNTTSTANSFTITGTNLSSSNISVGPLSGYSFSTTAAGTYTASLSLTQAGGTYSQTIFVEFTPSAAQAYTGNIPVSGGGASVVNITASGTGINTIATITSGAASAVTQSGATVAGSLTSTGCSAVTAYGIEYSTTMGFANGSGTAVFSTNIAAGNFSSGLTGLAPNTTYYYHAFATNSGGTAYGAEMSFTTSAPTTPFITTTTLAAFGNSCINTAAGPNSFTITGAALSTADITVGPLAGFTFSATSGGTYSPTLIITQPGGAVTQQVFVTFTPTAIQSYDGNIAVNGGGASTVNVAASGAGVNTAPTVLSGAATNIMQTTATIAGSLSATGCSAVTAYGVEYSTTNGFVNGTGTQVASTNLAGTDFTSNLTGLSVNTTYYYHAFSTNGGGTSYGSQQSFKTSGTLFTTTALTAFGSVCINSSSAANSFTLSSNAASSANIVIAALAGFSYSTTSTGTYTSTLTLAQPGGIYSQMIYVKFSPTALQSYNGNIVISGGGATASINVAASGTGINSGTSLTTTDATNVLKNSATVGGTLNNTGCGTTSGYGVEYSSIRNFTNGTGTKIYANNLSGSIFSVDLNNLVQNTTYYYKAFASSTLGNTYGNIDSLKTLSINSGLIIYSTPVLRNGILNFSLSGISPDRYQVNLLNTLGQLVYHKEIFVSVDFIDDRFTLSGKLPPGVYILQIKNTNNRVSENKRFIIE